MGIEEDLELPYLFACRAWGESGGEMVCGSHSLGRSCSAYCALTRCFLQEIGLLQGSCAEVSCSLGEAVWREDDGSIGGLEPSQGCLGGRAEVGGFLSWGAVA